MHMHSQTITLCLTAVHSSKSVHSFELHSSGLGWHVGPGALADDTDIQRKRHTKMLRIKKKFWRKRSSLLGITDKYDFSYLI